MKVTVATVPLMFISARRLIIACQMPSATTSG